MSLAKSVANQHTLYSPLNVRNLKALVSIGNSGKYENRQCPKLLRANESMVGLGCLSKAGSAIAGIHNEKFIDSISYKTAME